MSTGPPHLERSPSRFDLASDFADVKLSLAMKDVYYIDPMNNVILNNFTLLIPQGQIVSLVGDIRDVGDAVMSILSGLCTNYTGSITQLGYQIDPSSLWRNVSICPVDFFLLDNCSIELNVRIFLSAFRIPGRVRGLLELITIEEAPLSNTPADDQLGC